MRLYEENWVGWAMKLPVCLNMPWKCKVKVTQTSIATIMTLHVTNVTHALKQFNNFEYIC